MAEANAPEANSGSDSGSRPTSASTGGKAALKEQFVAFAKFGDKTADGKTIKLSQSDKWFKQAKVIDGKKVTTTDTGIAFRKISKYERNLFVFDWWVFLNLGSSLKVVVPNENCPQIIALKNRTFHRELSLTCYWELLTLGSHLELFYKNHVDIPLITDSPSNLKMKRLKCCQGFSEVRCSVRNINLSSFILWFLCKDLFEGHAQNNN